MARPDGGVTYPAGTSRSGNFESLPGTRLPVSPDGLPSPVRLEKLTKTSNRWRPPPLGGSRTLETEYRD